MWFQFLKKIISQIIIVEFVCVIFLFISFVLEAYQATKIQDFENQYPAYYNYLSLSLSFSYTIATLLFELFEIVVAAFIAIGLFLNKDVFPDLVQQGIEGVQIGQNNPPKQGQEEPQQPQQASQPV